MNVRLALVSALEALEVDDDRHAVDVLLTALEEIDDSPRGRPHRCECGQAFEWPGLRDAHRQFCSYFDKAAA